MVGSLATPISACNLLERGVAIPLYRVGHRRLQGVEVGGGTPTDIVMLRGGECQGAFLRPRPVNHGDMLVCVRDAVDVQEPWCDERAGAWFRGGRSFAEQLNFQPALF